MSDHPYTRALVDGFWNVTGKTLSPLVVAALPSKKFVSKFADVDVVVSFVDTLTAPEIVLLDAAVADDKSAFNALPEAKAAKIAAIQENTSALIAQGAQSGGLVYMATVESRFDVFAIYTIGVIGATPGFFPKKVTTVDGLVETEFANAAAYALFFGDMMDTYTHWKETGQVLRQSVNDAMTVAAVDAVVDSRTWPWVP